jgi:hypothetical protein
MDNTCYRVVPGSALVGSGSLRPTKGRVRGQMTCASNDDPCTESFIGDYFGVAVSAANVYVLAVSTYYPQPSRPSGKRGADQTHRTCEQSKAD